VRNRARHPPVNETGFEGIAYVTLPSKAEMSAQPKLDGELGCIDFLAHTSTTNEGRHDDRVRVPLANTVFQTGEPSTMISSSWERSSGQDGFKMRSRKQRKTVVIDLSAEFSTRPKDSNQTHALKHLRSHPFQELPALSVPLIPLTFPRKVDGHMGNIIRGVIGPDGNRMTASTELEQVVPQYFKSRGEPAQATSAWALVIPESKAHQATVSTKQVLKRNSDKAHPEQRKLVPDSEMEKHWQAFWQRDPPVWNSSIRKAIASGARLHKVLSGGGGWGKKAGLLSLDPVPSSAPSAQISKDDVVDTFDSVDDFSTALKPVLKDGDFIQFFISPAASHKEDSPAFETLKLLEGSTRKQVWSWEFGVVPSTVDSIPGESWQHSAAAASEEIVAFRGSFGALTEKGLTLMRGLRMDKKTGLAQNIGTTTIDVPFARWSAIRVLPKEAVETGAADSSKHAKSNNGKKSNTKEKIKMEDGSNFNTDAGNPS
jgi:hypothetical protein